MSLHRKKKKKRIKRVEDCFWTPSDFFSSVSSATLQGVTMPSLCIITKAAKATNGPHTDDSCHRFTKSALKEQVQRTVLTTRQKKKAAVASLVPPIMFFLCTRQHRQTYYTKEEKERTSRRRSHTWHRQREPSHRPFAPAPTTIVK